MPNQIPDFAHPLPGLPGEPGSKLKEGAQSGTDFAALVSKAIELARAQENLALATCTSPDEPTQSSEQQLFGILELQRLTQGTSAHNPSLPLGMYPGSMERILAARSGRVAASVVPVSSHTPSRPISSADVQPPELTDSTPTGSISKNRFVEWMDRHALTRSMHHCAMFVRHALEAAGMATADRPVAAGDYGPFLLRHGAQVVEHDESYVPQPGDTAVFAKTVDHPYGHIEVFDGAQWVSDFKQRSFSPYRDIDSTPPVTIYRIS